ncbi:sigma-70 family RNA polymerase sigma factor [Cytobacillus sp. FJAT-54145]|uniref:Sigma-70 family RNA polymerase sigma factor n=1 Tax=Cytobacillus spartinae TaxID=3299023 RepID=A0ABW6K8H1_9BACI
MAFSTIDTLITEDIEDLDALLEEIMVTYGTELGILAFSYVKNVETAKDIVQNVFIKCYYNLKSFRRNSTIKTWLYRITINECKDHLRSSFFRRVIPSGFIKDQTASTIGTPESTFFEKENRESLINAVIKLPAKYREVIFLFYIQELSQKEIADVLGITINTLKTRLRRAKSNLNLILLKEGLSNEWELQ